MPAKPSNIDEYLAALSEEPRAALEKLRKTIRAAAPKAEECISYGLAAFKLDGKPLVGMGATASHCAFYLMSGSTVDAHADDLQHYNTSKGTIRFAAAKPLPASLVRKLVKARIAENAALAQAKPATKRAAKPSVNASQIDPAVAAYVEALDHPLRKELEAVRRLILGVSPDIREGIKWNSPSFRTTEYFATINVQDSNRLRLILHTGAKAKSSATAGLPIADPTGLLKWLAKDRCLVTLAAGKELPAKLAALEAILRQWIRHL
jgi:uncharacterized protein YdhG (YjbR/CyaY superfamily)